MQARWLAAMLLTILMPLGAAAAWKEKPEGPTRDKAKAEKREATSVRVGVVFSKRDHEVIADWVHNHHSGLPPGLARKGQLPPGLQKHLIRNGTLPPGLEKEIHPLPVDLERQLPPLPADYRRVAIGGSVVIMNQNTRVIADVLVDIVR